MFLILYLCLLQTLKRGIVFFAQRNSNLFRVLGDRVLFMFFGLNNSTHSYSVLRNRIISARVQHMQSTICAQKDNSPNHPDREETNFHENQFLEHNTKQKQHLCLENCWFLEVRGKPVYFPMTLCRTFEEHASVRRNVSQTADSAVDSFGELDD